MLRIVAVASVAALLVAACGSARTVRRTQTGGTVALQGDQRKAMEDAHNQMSAHCGPNNYTIVEEGEVVVGTDSAGGEETYVAEDGTVVTEGGQSTRQATEWRVTYVCGQGQAAPPPQGPPPGDGYDDGYDDGYGDGY
jgi:hypothetical protein